MSNHKSDLIVNARAWTSMAMELERQLMAHTATVPGGRSDHESALGYALRVRKMQDSIIQDMRAVNYRLEQTKKRARKRGLQRIFGEPDDKGIKP